MSCSRVLSRLLLVVIPGLLLAVWGTTSCSRDGQTSEEGRVRLAFESWKTAIINHQPDQAMAYIPRNVYAYLNTLNTGPEISASGVAANPVPSNSPGVDRLLRTALEKKVPVDLRSKLTLDFLLQRIADRHLFNPRDLRAITLGQHISVNGNHAYAEFYYEGTLTALRLPFLKEDGSWKIDIMAILPYAEVFMRVDRAIKGETEVEQVDQLVNKLPSL